MSADAPHKQVPEIGGGEAIVSVVDHATWLAAVVGTRLMWLAADSEQWVSISPVPVASSLAANGGAVYALSSGGVLCGTPPSLTLCSGVTGRGVLFSRAFGLLVSDGPRLTTSTGEAYTLGDGWLPSAAATAMGGRVLLGLDARALRGVVWLSASPSGVGGDCPLARWWVDPRLAHCPLFVDTDDAGMGLSLADVSSEVATASTQTPLQTRLFSHLKRTMWRAGGSAAVVPPYWGGFRLRPALAAVGGRSPARRARRHGSSLLR